MRLDFIAYKFRQDGLLKTLYKSIRFVLTKYFHTYNKIRRALKQRTMPDSAHIQVHGFQLLLDLKNDAGISRDLYFNGTREDVSVKYLQNSGILQAGDVALDVGANIGYYAFIESALVGETGTVYALEPVEENYARLLQNISLNNSQNIEHYRVAASDRNGPAQIHVGKKRNWSSMVNTEPRRFVRSETVDAIRIDDFLEKKEIPNFVRMDVEGYEYAILEGMQKTLQRPECRNLLIEVHSDLMNQSQVQETFSLLRCRGFLTVAIIHEPHSGWLTEQQSIRPVIAHLARRIGDTEKMGSISVHNIDTVAEMCTYGNKLLYALFSKDSINMK